jgi:hypothetical protein
MMSLDVRFQVHTMRSKKMAVFWDAALCNVAKIGQHFRGAFCPGNRGRKHL